MRTPILEVAKLSISRDDECEEALAVDQFEKESRHAAFDVFRSLPVVQMIFTYLYLLRNKKARKEVAASEFRNILVIALWGDTRFRQLAESISAGGRLTVQMLLNSGWPYSAADTSAAVTTAGGKFHLDILLHPSMCRWMEEIIPHFRDDLLKTVAELEQQMTRHCSLPTIRDDGIIAEFLPHEETSEDLSMSVYGPFTATVENNLIREERVCMLRIRKLRSTMGNGATNADTVVFEPLTSQEEREFHLSADGRRRIVETKLLKWGHLSQASA